MIREFKDPQNYPRVISLLSILSLLFGVVTCLLGELFLPLSAAFLGHVISALVGLPFVLQETDFGTTCVVSMLVLGVFQVGLAFIFLGEGLKTTPAVTASLVSGLEPVLNPLLAQFLEVTAVTYAGTAQMAIFMSLVPLMAVLLSVVINRELPNRSFIRTGCDGCT